MKSTDSFNPLAPYNDLPLLPPRFNMETSSVLKEAILANRTVKFSFWKKQALPEDKRLQPI